MTQLKSITQVIFKKYNIDGQCENFHDSTGLTKTIYSNGEVVIDRCTTCGARIVTSEYRLPIWIDECEDFCHIKGDMEKLEQWTDEYLNDDSEFADNYVMSDLMEEVFSSCDSFSDDEIITVCDDNIEFGILLGQNDISYKKWKNIKQQFNDNSIPRIKNGDKVAFTSQTAWLITESDIYVLWLSDTEE